MSPLAPGTYQLAYHLAAKEQLPMRSRPPDTLDVLDEPSAGLHPPTATVC